MINEHLVPAHELKMIHNLIATGYSESEAMCQVQLTWALQEYEALTAEEPFASLELFSFDCICEENGLYSVLQRVNGNIFAISPDVKYRKELQEYGFSYHEIENTLGYIRQLTKQDLINIGVDLT